MTSSADNLRWLLNNLLERAAGIRCAIALTADGLLRCAVPAPRPGQQEDGQRENFERLAAATSAVAGTARVVAAHFGQCDKQTVIETDGGYYLIVAAGDNAYLAVYAGGDADLGLLAFEANQIVTKVGDELAASARSHAVSVPEG